MTRLVPLQRECCFQQFVPFSVKHDAICSLSPRVAEGLEGFVNVEEIK